ncbi:predicted protein [Phaeodactylum tricornutum CCAP 1055/1]|jgi:hypothetical protein|uniref:DUF4460 domain-containing protein n=2 Tax=Phaeodactylum tricornutum TaxID=2850 RepID=B7G6K4_PHATC|nr:predicted protein [Phaeodactylum tricornutum CCAP 1055/1]EEC45873.1 predicted protein [Phaeodactylum tricornutum CCAP 1055/1]|eukprot:XP_002182586.1 predicted protein [Phaeodactylum tricornutum CCAP 1055/1]
MQSSVTAARGVSRQRRWLASKTTTTTNNKTSLVRPHNRMSPSTYSLGAASAIPISVRALNGLPNSIFRFDTGHLAHRCFSAVSASSTNSKLRSLVKPFLLKCHPDVQTSDDAKQINLRAVQNLNSYLDSIRVISDGKMLRKPESSIFEVDFLIQRDAKVTRKKIRSVSSRKCVELQLPSWRLVRSCSTAVKTAADSQQGFGSAPAIARQQVEHHAELEIAKLLKVAGLTVPNDIALVSPDDMNGNRESLGSDDESQMEPSSTRPHAFHGMPSSRIRLSRYEQTREVYPSRIDWKKYNQIYKEAVADMHADIATECLIAKHPGRRRKHIASILSRVRLSANISVVEQVIAFRRLSLLLDENFNDLCLEDFGHLWEKMLLVLTPSRDYNSSSSARYKRLQRQGDSGFLFTVHPDNNVTIHIPIDFDDSELIQELEQNVWSFYELTGDGLDEIFPDGMTWNNTF